MNQRPPAQSVVQVRHQNTPSRTNKILQKFSHLRIRLPLSTQKAKDDKNFNNPYPNQTPSTERFEGHVKPYMSQPMLGDMVLEPYHSDSDDSYSHSRSRSGSIREMTKSASGVVRPFAIPEDSIAPLSPGIFPGSNADRLPVGAHAPHIRHSLLRYANSNQPPISGRQEATSITSPKPPEIPGGSSSERPPPLGPKNLPSLKAATPASNTSLLPVRTLTPKLSRTQLRESNNPDGLSQTLPKSPSPLSLPSVRPAAITYSSSLPTPQPAEVSPTIPRIRLERDPPRLTLPTHSYRTSMTLKDGAAARLSPSIIQRPPPLPILNLPPLPAMAAPSAPSHPREGLVGLRSMPELPQFGSNSDGEEGEYDVTDEDQGRGRTSSTLSYYASGDENYSRPSMSNSGNSGSLLQSESYSVSSSHGDDGFYPLTRPDPSHLNLSPLHSPPSLPRPDRKGKSKARQSQDEMGEEQDTSRTPTSEAPYRHYFNSQTYDSGSHPNLDAGYRRVPPPKDNIDTSLGHSLGSQDAVLIRPPMPSRSSVMSTHSGDTFILSNRPGLYKHASKSMVDIHTIQSKEHGEQIIQEEEQAVSEELKKRSVMSIGNAKFKEAHSILDVIGDSTDKGSQQGGSAVVDATAAFKSKKRISKAPPYEMAVLHPLRRRRSMPTFTAATDPPPYPSFAPFGTTRVPIKIQPRDDEGQEQLPEYSNNVYMRAVIPRKMEFVEAGVQAKDRKWRKVLCILEGTVLRIYQPPSTTGVAAIGEWWERQVGAGNVSSLRTETGTGGIRDSPSGPGVHGPQGSVEGMQKSGQEANREGPGQTDLVMRSTTPLHLQSQVEAVVRPVEILSSTRSRFGLAGLLKPARGHKGSPSDALNVSQSQTPRPSLNRSRTSSSTQSVSSMRTSEPGIAPSPRSGSISSRSATVPSPQLQPLNVGEGSGSGTAVHMEPDPNPADLIRVYTMQNAESGLGNDYIKRKNVIRVRVEGEQFLLQASNTADVVAWIEALQASANVALDLDERPMPKGPLFPRRRRRRPPLPVSQTGTVLDVPGVQVDHTVVLVV